MNRTVRTASGVAAAALAAVLVAGCSGSGGKSLLGQQSPTPQPSSSSQSQSQSQSSPSAPGTAMPSADGPTGSPTGAAPTDGTLPPDVKEFVDEFKTLQQTLETYWGDQIDGYQPPAQTIVFDGEHDDPSTFPTCGGERVTAENGFYCGPDNTIILDAAFFLKEYDTIGDSFLYVALAHEYGHSAQANLPSNAAPPDSDVEIQADCFSGAFLQNELDAGTITEEPGDEQEINQTLASVAGDYGTQDAHGTLAARADAFEYGRKNGPAACLDTTAYRR